MNLSIKKIDERSLKICDAELGRQYDNRKHIEINKASRLMNKIKVFYLVIMCFQYKAMDMSIIRPLVLSLSCLLNHIAVKVFERYPKY